MHNMIVPMHYVMINTLMLHSINATFDRRDETTFNVAYWIKHMFIYNDNETERAMIMTHASLDEARPIKRTKNTG